MEIKFPCSASRRFAAYRVRQSITAIRQLAPSSASTLSRSSGSSIVRHSLGRSAWWRSILQCISSSESDGRAVATNATGETAAASVWTYLLLPLRAPPSTNVTAFRDTSFMLTWACSRGPDASGILQAAFRRGLRTNRQNALRLSHRSRIHLGLASGRSPDLRFVELELPSQNISSGVIELSS